MTTIPGFSFFFRLNLDPSVFAHTLSAPGQGPVLVTCPLHLFQFDSASALVMVAVREQGERGNAQSHHLLWTAGYVLANASQHNVSLHHCMCTLLICVQFNLPVSTLLSSAMLLPSQSVSHLLLLLWECYPRRSTSCSGLLMQLGQPPTKSCFLNPPQTRILFYSSPSRVPFSYLPSSLSSGS